MPGQFAHFFILQKFCPCQGGVAGHLNPAFQNTGQKAQIKQAALFNMFAQGAGKKYAFQIRCLQPGFRQQALQGQTECGLNFQQLFDIASSQTQAIKL